MNFKLTTPILFLVFNRPDTTKKVFEEIRKAKPSKLFIAADGPRNPEEKKKTDAVRQYVKENIDWPCKVKTLFRNKNLGCKYAVSGAIDWFFENVEQGIILEDDCLPSSSFFRFCQELLKKYKNDKRIMQISGTNVGGVSKIEESYFFSKCFNAWGWATWRRAWKKYDVEMKDWKKVRFSKSFLKITTGESLLNRFKSWRLSNLTYLGNINTWDYQWGFACAINNGLCIVPKVNLITNMGFTETATHTGNYEKSMILTKKELKFPLKENKIVLDSKAYKKAYSKFFKKGLLKRIVKRVFNKFI